MKNRRLLMTSLTIGAILTRLSLPAFADLESFSATYGSSSSPLALGAPNFPQSLSLQKFDTALGHLTDIEILLTADTILQADVINFGAPAAFTGAQANATLSVNALGEGPSLSLATTPLGGSLVTGASEVGPVTTLGGTANFLVVPSDFSAYEYNGGLGSALDLDLTGVPSYNGVGPLGMFFGGEASAYGSVKIDYSYSVSDHEMLWVDLGLLAFGFAGFTRVFRCSVYPKA